VFTIILSGEGGGIMGSIDEKRIEKRSKGKRLLSILWIVLGVFVLAVIIGTLTTEESEFSKHL